MRSIKDIAIKANVSTGTVDRVIHKRSGVSETTRKKVLKIIEESNYTVNAVASILASKKTFVIATLLPQTKSNTEFWETPKSGIKDALEEIKDLGIQIQNFEYDQFDADSYVRSFKKLVDSTPSAALIAPAFNKETIEYSPLLDNHQIPYLFINTKIKGLKNLAYVGEKSEQAGFLAGKLFNWVLPENSEILIIEIRKNIINYTAINNRIEGLKSFINQSEKLIHIKRVSVLDIDNSQELNKQLTSYLDNNPKVNAIFVPSSKISAIARSIVTINRQDIKLGGFDTIPENVKYLKTDVVDFLISQKSYQQGYKGVKLLFNYLVHKNQPKKNYHLPIEIVLKENVDYLL
ncbi:substrate-binding domain-containing protein [Wenyingzhuangia sp. IMCC45533]